MAAHEGIAGLLPRSEAPLDGGQIGEPKSEQCQRRPGTGLLGRSGAVEDNESVPWQLFVSRSDLCDGKRHSAGDVAGVI